MALELVVAATLCVSACSPRSDVVPETGDVDAHSVQDAEESISTGAWTVVDPGMAVSVTGLWGTGVDDVYVTSPMLHRSGDLWTPMSGVQGSKIWGAAAEVYVIGDKIAHSRQHGSWVTETFPTDVQLEAVWGSDVNDIYVVGQVVGIGGRVFHSVGDGVWHEQSLPPLDQSITQFLAIWGTSSTDVYIVGAAGAILHSTGNGTWVQQQSGSSSYLHGVWGSSATDIYAVGLGGVILHSNGDAAWTISTPTVHDLLSVWGSSRKNVYAVGREGTILHFDGSSWTPMQSGTLSDLASVWGTSSTDVLSGGSFALIHRGP